jgi:hypothetical protein
MKSRTFARRLKWRLLQLAGVPIETSFETASKRKATDVTFPGSAPACRASVAIEMRSGLPAAVENLNESEAGSFLP